MKSCLSIFTVTFLILYLSVVPGHSKRGCCSHHGGVCGNKCCDGTPLSAKCRGTSSNSKSYNSYKPRSSKSYDSSGSGSYEKLEYKVYKNTSKPASPPKNTKTTIIVPPKLKTKGSFNNLEDALSYYNQYIESNPKNPKAYNYRGYIYADMENMSKACEDFQQACNMGDCFGLKWSKSKNICQ